MDYEYVPDCIDEIALALAYPFLFECLVCYPSTFVMIINLFMGADVRGTRGQQGERIPLHSPLGLDLMYSCWAFL